MTSALEEVILWEQLEGFYWETNREKVVFALTANIKLENNKLFTKYCQIFNRKIEEKPVLPV